MKIAGRLVSESEVQPFVASICGVGEVMISFLFVHCIPLGRTLLVDRDIEEFSSHLNTSQQKSQNAIINFQRRVISRVTYHDDNVKTCYAEEHLVSSIVVRSIVRTVDVNADNVAGLHGHVVDGACYCTGTNTSSVATSDGDEDGMDIWHAVCQHREGVIDPWAASRRESDERGETWDDPKLTDGGK